MKMHPVLIKYLSGKRLSYFISFLIAGMVAVSALFKSDSLIASLKNTNGYWAAAGLGCYWFNYLFRSMRFCSISEETLRFWPDAIRATCLHGLATYMLPFRMGDLTLPAILKSINNTAWIEGGRILIKSRILDISTLGLLMIFAAVFTKVQIPFSFRAGWAAIGVAMAVSPILISWVIYSGLKISSQVLRKFILEFQAVSEIKWPEVIQSLGIWVGIGGSLFCAARAVGLPLNPGDAIFLISVQLPFQLIPIQGFANAGNHEGGWMAALAVLGIPASSSLLFALASHALVFIYVVSLGAMSFLIGKISIQVDKNRIC
jgi:hypothetical protein